MNNPGGLSFRSKGVCCKLENAIFKERQLLVCRCAEKITAAGCFETVFLCKYRGMSAYIKWSGIRFKKVDLKAHEYKKLEFNKVGVWPTEKRRGSEQTKQEKRRESHEGKTSGGNHCGAFALRLYGVRTTADGGGNFKTP